MHYEYCKYNNNLVFVLTYIYLRTFVSTQFQTYSVKKDEFSLFRETYIIIIYLWSNQHFNGNTINSVSTRIYYHRVSLFSFWDIPSAWWQASTVTMGIGVAIAVIGALTLLAAASSFLPHILKTPKHTRILGSLQLLAGECYKCMHIFFSACD